MKNISILLINDNHEKVQLIKVALRILWISDVLVVSNYSKALALLQKRSFSLVFVELGIKDSPSGALDFILTVRKDVERFAHVHDIPVVITAGEVTRRQVELARDSGVTEFIIYPFSILYMTKVLKSVFKAPRELIVTKNFLGRDRRRKNILYSGAERRGEVGGINDRRNKQNDEGK